MQVLKCLAKFEAVAAAASRRRTAMATKKKWFGEKDSTRGMANIRTAARLTNWAVLPSLPSLGRNELRRTVVGSRSTLRSWM